MVCLLVLHAVTQPQSFESLLYLFRESKFNTFIRLYVMLVFIFSWRHQCKLGNGMQQSIVNFILCAKGHKISEKCKYRFMDCSWQDQYTFTLFCIDVIFTIELHTFFVLILDFCSTQLLFLARASPNTVIPTFQCWRNPYWNVILDIAELLIRNMQNICDYCLFFLDYQ